ncbi:MAG: hypothetical protein EBY48_11760, partial [Opitutae bacterium]|nr:hypothetical protein [Opitutae bacterium]
FYGAAAFIFLILVLFASVGLQENGTLYHWEIATCLLGTGLISILLFLPHFLQKIVDQLNDNGSQAHSELTQKAIFEVKELRSDLDSIALKIDKVPTLVDQIVRESINSTSDPSERIVDQIQAIQQELNTKLDRLEETSLASPLPPETDPKIESLYTKTEELYELLQKALSKLATIEQAQLTISPVQAHQLFDMFDFIQSCIDRPVGSLLFMVKHRELYLRPQCFGLTEIFFYGGIASP